jgi:hypothetical protein
LLLTISAKSGPTKKLQFFSKLLGEMTVFGSLKGGLCLYFNHTLYIRQLTGSNAQTIAARPRTLFPTLPSLPVILANMVGVAGDATVDDG